jgi:hypothetical protein
MVSDRTHVGINISGAKSQTTGGDPLIVLLISLAVLPRTAFTITETFKFHHEQFTH